MWKQQSTNITLLWYDYETWGTSPSRDRLAQFAAIRTDLDLNPIAEPIDIFCKPALDTVIDGGSVAITGLSPITLQEQGLSEWDFAHQIHTHMSQPGTCTVGYNSIRFDDECTRYMFYRNLLDPYAREWKNGNSRWDILDVVRMTKALRPDGFVWPKKEDGSDSFKLEQLTAVNGIVHEKAHDAVSDVKATIAMAKLIKQKQPKLFDFAFQLRSKHEVRAHINIEQRTPHLHFSGKIPAVEHCMGVEIPLMAHPDRNNEIIVIDIRKDPTWLLQHDSDTLRKWLYSKTDDLPEGATRPPFKTIHINKSPMIAPMSLLDDPTAERLGVNLETIAKHRAIVEKHREFSKLALDIFTSPDQREPPIDPEHALYSGFIDDHDRNILNSFVADKVAKDKWLDETHALHDDRLPEMIENVLARNFPEKLTDMQLNDWKLRRKDYLTSENTGQALTVEAALQKIEALIKESPDNAAFADTLLYLNQLNHNWFSTEGSTGSDERLAGNLTEQPVSEASDPKPDLNDQLDLF